MVKKFPDNRLAQNTGDNEQAVFPGCGYQALGERGQIRWNTVS